MIPSGEAAYVGKILAAGGGGGDGATGASRKDDFSLPGRISEGCDDSELWTKNNKFQRSFIIYTLGTNVNFSNFLEASNYDENAFHSFIVFASARRATIKTSYTRSSQTQRIALKSQPS